MYIGPWQEYNLSKTRTTRPVGHATLKHGLEEAIAKTLDPNTAQAAIAAVETYFANQSAANPLPPGALQPHRPKQHRNHHTRVPRPRRQLPPLTYKNLAEAEISINSARELNFSDSCSSLGTPLSVRSSQSEPIARRATDSELGSADSRRLPAISAPSPNRIREDVASSNSNSSSGSYGVAGGGGRSPSVQNQLPALEPSVVQRKQPLAPSALSVPSASARPPLGGKFAKKGAEVQPVDPSPPNQAYHASVAVAFLRLERSQRTRAALERVTGWKSSRERQGNSNETTNAVDANQKSRQNPFEREKEKKLELIQTMKQAYTTHSAQLPSLSSQPLSAPPFSDSHTSLPPIEESRPCTPEIKALHLTETDLQLVSKYFPASSSSFPERVDPSRPREEDQAAAVERTVPHSPLPAPSLTAQVGSPTGSIMDELFVGGIDGLLRWSSQLDVSNL